MGNVFAYINADGLGDFGYLGNWIDETSPYVFGPPGPTDFAIVEAVGSINGTANVSTLFLAGAGGLLTSTLEFTTQELILEGNLALSDRDYSEITDEVEEAGASTVTLTAGELYIDNPSGGNGYNVNTGISGTTVFDVGLNKGDKSIFNLSGSATTVLVEAGNTVIGDAGDGSMTISSGAELHDLGWLLLGSQSGANGNLTVTGESSGVYTTGPIFIGEFGTGNLSILAGGTVSTAVIALGPDGGQPDTLLVSGANSQLIAGEGQVASGPTSTMTVADGGSAQFTTFKIGYLGTGHVLVEGAGSMIQVDGSFDVDHMAQGTLQVTSGAKFVVESTPIIVVGGYGGNSSFSISGLGSSFSSLTGLMQVGGVGAGVVTVSSGGTMTTAATGGPAVELGALSGSQGLVTINGTGSNWSVTGEFDVGYGTSGTLQVEAGGRIETGNSSGNAGFVVGNQSGSAGAATITGTGSTLTNSGGFLVGDAGSGTLTISSGAVVSTSTSATAKFFGVDGAVIGDASGSNGQVDVTGAGSKWAVGTDLVIGQGGSGSLMIGSGAQVSVGGPAELNSGHVLLTGGELSVSKTFSVSSGQLVSGRGTVQVSSLINSGTLNAAGGTLSFIRGIIGTGRIDIDTGATLSLSSSVSSGQTTVFESATSKLVLGTPASFASTIYDFIKGDTIDLSKIIASSFTYSGQTLAVHESGGASLALKFGGTYALSNFGMTTDGRGGTFITHT